MTATKDVHGPAEIYDAQFVPALFAQWGPVVLDAATVRENDCALDAACGTGALTVAAAERVGRGESVVGLDVNPDMLTVARRKSTQVNGWRARPTRCHYPTTASTPLSANSASCSSMTSRRRCAK